MLELYVEGIANHTNPECVTRDARLTRSVDRGTFVHVLSLERAAFLFRFTERRIRSY